MKESIFSEHKSVCVTARAKHGKLYAGIAAVLCLAFAIICLTGAFSTGVYAAGDLDEIVNYEITVDVNQDATLTMVYHIEWKVLDSDSEGPLSWVNIGIPNSNYVSYEALTSTIKDISYSSSGGSNLKIVFDKNYYKDEIVTFEFKLIQDYMYDVNHFTEGETVYSFTPGWFDALNIDRLTVRWNGNKVLSASPAYKGGEYYTWEEKNLGHGESIEISVTYPNDAFGFDVSKSFTQEDDDSSGVVIVVIVLLLVFMPLIIGAIGLVIGIFAYLFGAAFGTKTTKNITRTKVEYYPDCPGCGAPRPEGKDNCEFCGRSFIKSEVKIEEKDIPAEEKEIRSKSESGLYRYSSSPNTYVRVKVVNVPVHRSSSFSGFSGSSRSSGSRSSHSSHHSCAHSSCACACACACAGGGRAGCTTKDFYNTNLKLKQLEMKKKHGK